MAEVMSTSGPGEGDEAAVLLRTGDGATETPLEVQAAAVPAPAPTAPARDIIRLPVRHNDVLRQVLRRVNADVELHTLWQCANVNAVDRAGISDHGPVHIQIVTNIALKLARLLFTSGVQPSCVQHHGLTPVHAEVIVVLAALLHDLGIAIHRDEHEHFSLILAPPKLRELLDGLYPVAERTIVISEALHAIIAHAREGRPLTVEAGVVKVADALDMTKGRSRIPFEAGRINIHSLSAMAVERVTIQRGADKPVHVEIVMSNSAGIFQVDELLRGKLLNSGLAHAVEVVARVEDETERRLVEVVRF